MPTYDYYCTHCESKSEVLQKITDEPLKQCSHCGKGDLKRGFGGGVGVVFKGTGYYVTDYAPKCPCGHASQEHCK